MMFYLDCFAGLNAMSCMRRTIFWGDFVWRALSFPYMADPPYWYRLTPQLAFHSWSQPKIDLPSADKASEISIPSWPEDAGT